MSESLREALIRIRDGRMPCRECGEEHVFHPWTDFINGKYVPSRNYGTWMAEDGHPFRRLTPSEYAQKVLK